MMSDKERFIVAHAKAPKHKEGKKGPLSLLKTAKNRCGVPLLLVTDKRPGFIKARREVIARTPRTRPAGTYTRHTPRSSTAITTSSNA